MNLQINSKIRPVFFFVIFGVALLFTSWSCRMHHDIGLAVDGAILSAFSFYFAYRRYTLDTSRVEVVPTQIDSKLRRTLAILVHVPYVFFFAIVALILVRWSRVYWIAHEVLRALESAVVGGLMVYLACQVINKITRIALGKINAWSRYTLIALCGEMLLVVLYLFRQLR